MRVLGVASVLFLVVASLAACSSSSGSSSGSAGVPAGVACVRNTVSGGCACSLGSRSLQADEEVVPSCDSPPAGSQCCYDLDTRGLTTTCDCGVPSCSLRTDGPGCDCQFYVARPKWQKTGAASCTEKLCCGNGDHCSCTSPVGGGFCAASGEQQVSSCAAPTQRACGSGRAASSCAGLQWKTN